ncbi:unnamed protein product, partial [Linum tenue]
MVTMEQEGQEEEEEANACKSKSSSSWEEDMYWTHFKFTHFFRLLHAGFHRTLALPNKFSGRLKSKLPETVTLTGPSGANWTIRLTTTTSAADAQSTVCFSRGWSEFAADNSLQVDDLLVFKYNGESRFDVLILETQTSCENPAAYFAKMREISGEPKGSPEVSVLRVFIASPLLMTRHTSSAGMICCCKHSIQSLFAGIQEPKYAQVPSNTDSSEINYLGLICACCAIILDQENI